MPRDAACARSRSQLSFKRVPTAGLNKPRLTGVVLDLKSPLAGVKNMLRVPVVGATQQWGKPGQPLDSIQEAS